MNTSSQTFILNITPQMTKYKQGVEKFTMPSLNCRSLCLSRQLKHDAGKLFKRKDSRYYPTVALHSDAQIASAFEDFCISSTNVNDGGELKISIELSGTKTQRIFDDVFDKMVGAAQPIPGFRRIKGGKTPDIPKDILLEVLGPSRVFKEVIKKIINVTVAEYVEKEHLKVGKNLRVEQSFEDLETTFDPGQKFSFDAVVQLLQQD